MIWAPFRIGSNMKKTLLATTCAVILVLVSFISVVKARVTVDERIDVIQELRERDWEPGEFIRTIIRLIFLFFIGIWLPS